MLIYRLESKNNPSIGVFSNGDASVARKQALAEGEFNPYNHPSDYTDMGETPYNSVCGFQSLEIYRIWFVTPTIRAALFKSGDTHMRVYDVPDHLVHKGMVQVKFKISDATSVREATPEEIL